MIKYFVNCFVVAFASLYFQGLTAYVTVPKNYEDSTDRMNTGGDPANRGGLRDQQRPPEYRDDYWGVTDRYYIEHGVQDTGNVVNPAYNSMSPPYYPLPNQTYPEPSYNQSQYQYDTSRGYRPAYPR